MSVYLIERGTNPTGNFAGAFILICSIDVATTSSDIIAGQHGLYVYCLVISIFMEMVDSQLMGHVLFCRRVKSSK